MRQRMLKHGNFVKLAVATKMIGMRVSIDDDHRLISDCLYGGAQIANSAAGVDQGRLLVANYEIDDGAFIVTRLIENVKSRGNLIEFEPILGGSNPPEIRVGRFWPRGVLDGCDQ